jgi:hypothetical protein
LDNLQKELQESNKKADGGVDMTGFIIPKEEVLIVEQFLDKFVISTENAMRDQIDLRLMIEALPNKVMDYSFESIELFNFMIFQDALDAFQHLDIVKAFEFFDEKNKHRV